MFLEFRRINTLFSSEIQNTALTMLKLQSRLVSATSRALLARGFVSTPATLLPNAAESIHPSRPTFDMGKLHWSNEGAMQPNFQSHPVFENADIEELSIEHQPPKDVSIS